jgi:prophage tail gpP-like protein
MTADTFCRIVFTNGTLATVASGNAAAGGIPCKEWSIDDDILNMCDSAAVTVSNVDGENASMFSPGQQVALDLQNDSVASGQWVRSFTGVVTRVNETSNEHGGSNIQLTMMDNGWYLTNCKAPPLLQIGKRTLAQLFAEVIEPTWGITQIVSSNNLNVSLKRGRQAVEQAVSPTQGAILPFVQVEPGQTVADVVGLYCQRLGLLINAGADGSIVLFTPNYGQQALFQATYRPGALSGSNNLVGSVSFERTIDGLYTQTQCWSTSVLSPQQQGNSDATNPNASFRHATYNPPELPVPFVRREVISDGEAINQQLRLNRAVWKFQMGLFQSWRYECEFDTHQQNGSFFVSDSMIGVQDDVHGLSGVYYVQSVRRSQTLGEGSRTKLVIRRPWLLNPSLNSLNPDAGTASLPTAKPTTLSSVKLPARIAKQLGRTPAGKTHK